MLRAAAVLLVGTAAVAIPPAAALAAGGVQVTLNNRDPRPLSRSFLQEGPGNVDQPQVSAKLRQPPNPDRTIQIKGTTAQKLVELARVGPPAVRQMTIRYAGFDAPVTLTGAEVRGEGFSGDPNLHAAIFDPFRGDEEVVFFRPLRYADEPRTDTIEPPVGVDLLVDLTTDGERLAVSLATTPADREIDPGGQVTFDPSVSPPPSTETTYDWDFGDGTTLRKTDAGSVAHVYAEKGNFTAKLTVTVREDGASGIESVQVQVGKPTAGNTNTTPANTTGLGGGGAPAGGGKTNTGGRGKGNRKASNGGAAKRRKTSSASKRAAAARRAAARRAAAARREAAENTTTAGGQGRSNGAPSTKAGSGAPATSQGAGNAAPDGAARRRSQVPPATSGPGVLVRGILLAGSSAFQGAFPTAPANRSSDSTLPSATASSSSGSPGGIVGWLGGGAIFIAVLAGGATLELRMLARHVLRVA